MRCREPERSPPSKSRWSVCIARSPRSRSVSKLPSRWRRSRTTARSCASCARNAAPDGPRSERARRACATCGKELSDECLYVQAMRAMREELREAHHPRRTPTPPSPRSHRRSFCAAKGRPSSCSAFARRVRKDPSAQCFSTFWRAVSPPPRCTLAMAAYEVELARQGKASTWTGSLGGPCNTQISLAFDERRKTWTYTELR